jgi:diaminohydroxyphosphoribosylaminopyrimidine deaminase/5-amino-6-(5-phosphoribosylamino)uracil reductase
MRRALSLARRAFGRVSPNPMVGAVLVRDGEIIGEGWHHRAGEPHAEIEALRDAARRGNEVKGATLFVTLEPCSTQGRTPPCTEAVIAAGIRRVVVAAIDPNPAHAGRGLEILRAAGIEVAQGLLAEESTRLNEAFNHWITHRTPFVTVKAAMTLDGKIATASGESKWITGEKSRGYGMRLRLGSDAILVGLNTVVKDNPRLTIRAGGLGGAAPKVLRRIVLDPLAETPLSACVVRDESVSLTTVVASEAAPQERIDALRRQVRVVVAPGNATGMDLAWLLKWLGSENVVSLLVEGGGETNAGFLLRGLAHRVAFFYAPIVLGGRSAPNGVAGEGVARLADKICMTEATWRKLGDDMLLTARVSPRDPSVPPHQT